jgi:hypothetical protein
MAALRPISVGSNGIWFLTNAPATSLIEYLSFGEDAIGLVLGGGDPRRLLYSLFAEQENGTRQTRQIG